MVTAVPLVTCASHVEGPKAALPADAAKRLLLLPGVLRLGIAPRAYIPGLGTPFEGGYSYKMAAGVNAGNPGRTVQLSVVEPTARLSYAGTSGRSIRLRACARAHPRWRDGLPMGDWTGYPGGIIVSEATCVHLVVRSGARTYRLALGLGVRCP